MSIAQLMVCFHFVLGKQQTDHWRCVKTDTYDMSCQRVSNIQLNLAITAVKGPTNFICYRRLFDIANIIDKRNNMKRPRISVCYGFLYNLVLARRQKRSISKSWKFYKNLDNWVVYVNMNMVQNWILLLILDFHVN